eukprot:TRINITY_DN106592_c0_g1_i1.p1 TRINITY_DN106592_c0_g1~~TRINITY_DN106592_c0_g1_i1.p1  ORF type:complete len:207 (-),score=41.23 TRINITY_DN106592_c0_g1_i1:14-634(-)
MCGAQRLSELLRRFKLPPAATQAELRRAYYKRAKLLHPDIAGEASEADFKRLREDYDEATKLLVQAKTGFYEHGPAGRPGGPRWQRPPDEPGWDTPGGQRWQAGAFGGNFHGYTSGFREGEVNFDPRAFREQQQSHVKKDGQGGYTYEAAGSGNSFSARASSSTQRSMNPAHIFKGMLLMSATLFGGNAILARMRQDASSFGRVYA